MLILKGLPGLDSNKRKAPHFFVNTVAQELGRPYYLTMRQYFILLSVFCLLISSCGGKQTAIEKMIPAANVEITGADARLVKVAGDVKLFMVQDTYNNKRWSIRALVPLENTESASGFDNIYSSHFDLLDNNYSVIHDHFGLHFQNKAAAVSFLASPAGTQKNLVFEPIWESISYYEYKKVVDFINRTSNITFELSIINPSYRTSVTTQVYDTAEAESDESIEEANTDDSATSNWDDLLDEYERFVDKCISLSKKASDGDVSALTEYMSVLEKAQNLSGKLSAADDVMTSAQANRYYKIMQKLADAAN